MAKKNNEIPQTMEDYLLSQLNEPVILKGGETLKDAIDGHELTKQEAIATNLINLAMKGDVRAAQYIQSLQLRAQATKKK